MDATLDDEVGAHPGAVLVLQAGVSARLTSPTAPVSGPEAAVLLTSVHGPWAQVSATTAGSTSFAEVDGRQALPRLVVSGRVADRLGVDPTSLVTATMAERASATSD